MKQFKVGLISLGCAKNLVDSEVMLGLLQGAGYVLTSYEEEAEILIVNTCAFIDSAKDEAVQTIIDMGQYKQDGVCKLLIVTGCLAQRYKEELLDEMPEIDAVIGTGQFSKIVEICEKLLSSLKEEHISLIDTPGYIYDHSTPRILTTPGYSAYLKIAEGCNHHCTYCIIPQLRGPLRSRSISSILIEAHNLAKQGVKEINLIAQDTTAYGQDLSGKDNLLALLSEMVKVEGLEWIRLLYAHPAHFTQELLDLIARQEKICPYIDLPLQHIHDDVLQQMGRRFKRREIENLINRMRGIIPNLALRTSLMVGFPGETEEHFQALLDFVKQARFECLGVFTYSKEEGTAAAKLLPQVPEKVKNKRRDLLLQTQQEIVFQKNQASVGKEEKVLVESDILQDGYAGYGRTICQAPEVDGVVYLQGGKIAAGDIVTVKIIDTKDYDLAGKVIKTE